MLILENDLGSLKKKKKVNSLGHSHDLSNQAPHKQAGHLRVSESLWRVQAGLRSDPKEASDLVTHLSGYLGPQTPRDVCI